MHKKKKVNGLDFVIIDEINFLFFVNLNSIHTLIGAIEKLNLVKIQALADLNKLLYFKTK